MVVGVVDDFGGVEVLRVITDQALNSLLIFGPSGVGKTETLTRHLRGEYVIPLKGRLSARSLYNEIRL